MTMDPNVAMNRGVDITLAILSIINLALQIPGIYFLDKTRIQHLYIMGLGLSEVLICIVRFTKIVTRMCLQGSRFEEFFINKVDRYFDCMVYTGLSLLYYVSMLMITIDRYMICHLSINYSKYWNVNKAKTLMYIVAATSLAMYFGVEINYQTTNEDINKRVHLFFYLPLDGLFVITAITTYSSIFQKYISIRKRAQSYGNVTKREVKSATSDAIAVSGMMETSSTASTEQFVMTRAIEYPKRVEMTENRATEEVTITKEIPTPRETPFMETAKRGTKMTYQKPYGFAQCFKESKFYVSFLLIATFFLFILTADIVYLSVIEIGKSKYSGVILNVIRISYTVSFLCDGLIYIMLDRRVRKKLFKALGLDNATGR